MLPICLITPGSCSFSPAPTHNFLVLRSHRSALEAWRGQLPYFGLSVKNYQRKHFQWQNRKPGSHQVPKKKMFLFFFWILEQWFSKCVSRITASTPMGNLLEMKILGLHLRPAESKTPGIGSCFWFMRQFENYHSRARTICNLINCFNTSFVTCVTINCSLFLIKTYICKYFTTYKSSSCILMYLIFLNT